MFRRWLEKLRGSSREPEDLALGTKRPGDFVEPEEGEELVLPNPHDQDEDVNRLEGEANENP